MLGGENDIYKAFMLFNSTNLEPGIYVDVDNYDNEIVKLVKAKQILQNLDKTELVKKMDTYINILLDNKKNNAIYRKIFEIVESVADANIQAQFEEYGVALDILQTAKLRYEKLKLEEWNAVDSDDWNGIKKPDSINTDNWEDARVAEGTPVPGTGGPGKVEQMVEKREEEMEKIDKLIGVYIKSKIEST